jgi:hypothetical protein
VALTGTLSESYREVFTRSHLHWPEHYHLRKVLLFMEVGAICMCCGSLCRTEQLELEIKSGSIDEKAIFYVLESISRASESAIATARFQWGLSQYLSIQQQALV